MESALGTLLEDFVNVTLQGELLQGTGSKS